MFKSESYQNISSFLIVGSVITGLSFSGLLLGILFKTQLYPGEKAMMMVSYLPSVLLAGFMTVYSLNNDKGFIKRNAFRFALVL